MGGKINQQSTITAADAGSYDALAPLVYAMRIEYSDLAKKKPDATLNRLKVQAVNRLLTDLREVLKNEPTFKYLDLLSDEDLPQYSDVTVMLGQYVAAMESFRKARQYYDHETSSMEWRRKG